MAAYAKFIAAGVGLTLMLVNQIFGVDLTGYSQGIIDAISTAVAIATAVSVHQIPNAPKP